VLVGISGRVGSLAIYTIPRATSRVGSSDPGRIPLPLGMYLVYPL
jgi:hypothetical protein